MKVKGLYFAAGAAVGAVTAWLLTKNNYQIIKSLLKIVSPSNELREETLAGVSEAFEDMEEKKASEEVETDGKKEDQSENAYKKIVNAIYGEAAGETVTDLKEDRPQVIPPEEFGEYSDYETITLNYYLGDDTLADEDDELVEDIDDVVGSDFTSHFGEYEEDTVYVRNDKYMAYYEICKDYRSWKDVARKKGIYRD